MVRLPRVYCCTPYEISLIKIVVYVLWFYSSIYMYHVFFFLYNSSSSSRVYLSVCTRYACSLCGSFDHSAFGMYATMLYVAAGERTSEVCTSITKKVGYVST